MVESREHNLVVRNTFIDVEVADDPYEAPERTRSDPTGGKSKDLMSLGRIPDRPVPIQVKVTMDEDTDMDVGEFEPMRITEPLSGNLCGIDEGEEEEDDAASPGLARTVTQRAQPLLPRAAAEEVGGQGQSQSQSQLGGGRGLGGFTPAAAPGGTGPVTMMALNNLLLAGEDPRPPQAKAVGGPAAVSATYAGMAPFAPWAFGPFYGMSGMSMPSPMPSPMTAPMPSPVVSPLYPLGQGQRQRGEGQEAEPQGQTPSLGSAAGFGSGAPLGAPLGALHSFHQETKDMGQVSPDFRMFTKVGYEGRLSVVSESRVHQEGVHRYLVQFTSGELSRADGVGFVFSSRLPCAKNIQRIVSIFVNQRGRICMRVFADVVRASACVKPLELGDWVELAIDLDQQVASFHIWGRRRDGWPPLEGRPDSSAEFPYGAKLAKLNHDTAGSHDRGKEQAKPMKLNVGHLACVVKNVGVTVTLGS